MIEIFQQYIYNKIEFYEDKLLNESYYKDRTPLSLLSAWRYRNELLFDRTRTS